MQLEHLFTAESSSVSSVINEGFEVAVLTASSLGVWSKRENKLGSTCLGRFTATSAIKHTAAREIASPC